MLKRCWLVAVAWLALCGACSTLGAGTAPFTVTHFGAAEGLPDSVVFSLLQTRNGYLWAGTQHGLARFDGVRFTVFDENNTPGLSNSKIKRLFEDSRGNLWIGTESGGAVRVDPQGQLTSVSKGPAEVAAVCEDRTGDVWLYYENDLLERYRQGRLLARTNVPGQISVFRALVADEPGMVLVGTMQSLLLLELTSPGGQGQVPQPQPIHLVDVLQPESRDTNAPPPQTMTDMFHFLLPARDGGFWLLANGRIRKLKGGQPLCNWGTYQWLSDMTTPVIAACEDREGNLIVGTYGDGVYWFDANGNATHLGKEDGLSSNSILSLAVDKDGCLWVGTNGGGLNRVKRKFFTQLEITAGTVVQSLCEGAGGLWIGYNNDRLDFWSNGVARRFTLPSVSPLVTNSSSPWYSIQPYVKSVVTVRDATGSGSRVLVGTVRGLTHLFELKQDQFEPKALPERLNWDVSAIFQDRSGRVWVGTQGGLLLLGEQKLFTVADGLPANAVRALAEDRDGALWVGTDGGGVAQLRDGRFTTFGKADGLPNTHVSSLHVDAEGVLWVGTEGGLARFHKGKGFSTLEGLPFNSIAWLVEDTRGFLWLGSNLGLMRVAKQALNDFAEGRATAIPCRTYGEADGLPAGECTYGSQPGALCSSDGTLWFPTIKGLAMLNPARLSANTNPPPVVIESVRIGGQLQNTNALAPPLKEVVVPAGREDLEIQYASLNLSAPEKGLFKYRLIQEGQTNGWHSVAENVRAVPFPKLQPGRYRFEVTACNEDDVWNETGASLAVTVLPAFWQTWWFRIASAVTLLAMIVGGVHYVSTQKLQRQVERLRHQEALEKERARIARDIHDQVGASLTQVSLLGELVESDKDDPKVIEGHARQISQTALETTRALDEIVWTVNPSNDTLDGLINYVCKYAQEYLAVAGLRYRLDVPSQLPSTPISPELRHNVFLAAKEAVTNVVRHARASSVRLRLQLEPGCFILEIEDNGCGLAGGEEKSTRNGLRNMRKRLEDIGGQFDIGPGSEGGTCVRLTAPLAST